MFFAAALAEEHPMPVAWLHVVHAVSREPGQSVPSMFLTLPTANPSSTPARQAPRPVRPKCRTVAISLGSIQRTLRAARTRRHGIGRDRNASASG